MKYREIIRKLTALGCYELPRKGGGSHRKSQMLQPDNAADIVVAELGRSRP